MNRLKFISGALYQLKRRYGEKITIYNRLSSATDLETGAKTVSLDMRRVNRAIVLPVSMLTELKELIAPDRLFRYGGLFDTTQTTFIVDRKDIPDFKITTDSYFLFAGRRYDVATLKEFENLAYLIIGKQVLGADATTLVPISAHSDIDFRSEGDNE
jgi:hypothetical protein